MIRLATLTDIDSLLKIERVCFTTDRLSRRNFRYLLTKAHAQTLVAEHSGHIQGYALLLLSNGTSMARLYSFAVASEYQRQGIHSGREGILAHFTIDGNPLALLTIHPLLPYDPTFLQYRNQQLANAQKILTQINTPKIVMGNLNATPWSPYYRQLLKH